MPHLLLIDDDEISRELLLHFAAEAGFHPRACPSGDHALTTLAAHPPDAILADMRMPGLTGNPLARALRAACPPHTRIVAMSASPQPPAATSAFDAFLLKPFTPAQLHAALTPEAPAEPLSLATFQSLADSMPRAQLLQLYAMCLDDADRRIALMRTAAAARDADAYTRAAHAIKGGCGMVGAVELASLASAMEEQGPLPHAQSDPLAEFLLASARLRRMLDAQN